MLEQLASAFTPEARKHGSDLSEQGVVALAQASDTAVQAYVRVSTPIRVALSSEAISSVSFVARCSCPAGRKRRLCKHVWATLLQVEKNHPDFLDSKRVVGPPAEATAGAGEDSFKQKQADNRKAHYQKQKARAKEQKQDKRNLESGRSLKRAGPQAPEAVVAALAYFSENGFPMLPPIDVEAVKNARKLLSRVFHPDKGGSHAEMLALNENAETLIEYAL